MYIVSYHFVCLLLVELSFVSQQEPAGTEPLLRGVVLFAVT